MIDPGGVEAAGSALDAMHCVALLQQQLRQVAAVLAGDASDQGAFAVAHGCHCRCYSLLSPVSSLQRSGGGMRLAIHAPNLGLSLPDQPFGKDVANRGLYTALASHGGFEQISFCTAEQPPLVSLQQQFGAAPGAARLSISSLMQTDAALGQAGPLLRGQPYLSELAWERGHRHGHQAYSLVGMIHTLAPPKVRELIGEVLLAPVQPWDALICTSPAVRQCLEGLLDRWQVHLSQRFGGTRAPRPQLPLLPLGVNQAALLEQRTDQRSRDFLRRHLRLAEHDVLVLWLGRLSFFEKAYPQGMFIALQKAAQRCTRRLHLVMAGWFPGGESDRSRYQESALCHAPNVPVHFLDGKNLEVVRCCWAATDLFLSLVDNPQETFGLAPVEAMAAGLPVVVSDWDGYRYTVSDGVEGFRVPTLAPPMPGKGRSWPCSTTMACSHIRTMSVQWHSTWPLTPKRRLRRLRASLKIRSCVSAWVRRAASPCSSVSTGPWWRVCTISCTRTWLSVVVPLRNASAWRLSTLCGLILSAILHRLRRLASGLTPSCA